MTTPDAAAIADEIERAISSVHASHGRVRTSLPFETAQWRAIIAALRSSSEKAALEINLAARVKMLAAVTAERDSLRREHAGRDEIRDLREARLREAEAENAALRSSSDAAAAPGHTDLMVPLETIGPWLAAQRAELSGPAMGALSAPVAINDPILPWEESMAELRVELAHATAENATLSKRVEELSGALAQAAEHFDGIARKAEHWRAVVQKNEIAEERWIGIRNYARHRARVCRAALTQPKGDSNG